MKYEIDVQFNAENIERAEELYDAIRDLVAQMNIDVIFEGLSDA